MHSENRDLQQRKWLRLAVSIVLMTAFLTWFFYIHEILPRPVRALTAVIETQVAIASGISHYLDLGIGVYESAIAVIAANLVFSTAFVLFVTILKKRIRRKQL